LYCKFDLQPVDVLHERRIDLPNPLGRSICQMDVLIERRMDGCVARTPDRFAKSIRQIDLAIQIGDSNWRFKFN
jgi:hypothetical protein